MNETRARSLVKTVGWRLIGSCTTTGIMYLATGNLPVSAAAGVTDAIFKIGLMYVHERAWDRIQWGKYSTPQHPYECHNRGQQYDASVSPSQPSTLEQKLTHDENEL